MVSDGNGQHYEKQSEQPMPCYEYSAVKQSKPECCDGGYLYSKWYCLMNHEVGDVGSEFRMVHKPVVQFPVASQEQSC